MNIIWLVGYTLWRIVILAPLINVITYLLTYCVNTSHHSRAYVYSAAAVGLKVGDMASVEREPNGCLGAGPLTGSRGRAPGQGLKVI